MSGRVRSWKTDPTAAGGAAFAGSAVFFAGTAAAVPLRGETVLVVLWCVLIAAVAGFGAWRLGPVFGVPLALAAAVAIDSFYIAPYRTFDARDWVNYAVTAMYLAIGVLVGVILQATQRRASASETARGKLDEEQAALRRVATLVARGVAPGDVFSAVALEMRDLLHADVTRVVRFEPDGTGTLVAGTGADGQSGPLGPLTPPVAAADVLRSGHTAPVDNYGPISAEMSRRLGVSGPSPAAVASPVIVAGSLWGAIVAGSGNGPLPAETEQRMAEFTELVAIAIGNAASRAELAASRARVVVAGDEARRRLERDLHDGVQQRLVSLALRLRRTEKRLPGEQDEARTALSETVQALNQATEEVREIAQGIHPAILTQAGLAPALRTLARGCAVPVELSVGCEERLPEPVEAAAYYAAAEALTNATKHAEASRAAVTVQRDDGHLHVRISDDGVGGADPSRGSGLTGLRDRVEALGGSFSVRSRRGEGTSLDVVLPLATAGSQAGSSG